MAGGGLTGRGGGEFEEKMWFRRRRKEAVGRGRRRGLKERDAWARDGEGKGRNGG